jgi:hypothetical protein
LLPSNDDDHALSYVAVVLGPQLTGSTAKQRCYSGGCCTDFLHSMYDDIEQVRLHGWNRSIELFHD